MSPTRYFMYLLMRKDRRNEYESGQCDTLTDELTPMVTNTRMRPGNVGHMQKPANQKNAVLR